MTDTPLTPEGRRWPPPGHCFGCGHPAHPSDICDEPVHNGDPSNGPAYCPCAQEIESMAQELRSLRAARVAAPSDGLRARILKLSDASEGRGEWLLGWQAAIEAAADIVAAAPTADPGGLRETALEEVAYRAELVWESLRHEDHGFPLYDLGRALATLAATPTEDQP